MVVLHRIVAWILSRHKKVAHYLQGEKIMLYENGQFLANNLGKGLVSEDDSMQGVRKSALTEDLKKIDKIYIERNGDITVIKKELE